MDRRTDALPTKLVCDHMLSLNPGGNVGTSVFSLFSLRDHSGSRILTSRPLPERPRPRYVLLPIPTAHQSHIRHHCRRTRRLAHEAGATWLKVVAIYPICAQGMLCLDNQ